MKSLATSIGILGTCVSVDAFKFVEHEGLTDKTAMRDFSIFNTWDKRPSINIGKITHSSSLHSMWLNTLWDGRVFEFLKDNAGEYLLIDLTDERHEMFKVDGCYFCLQGFIQTELFNELSLRGIEYSFCSQADFEEDEVQKKIQYFCEQIKKIYCPEQIIINKFYLMDSYRKDGKIEKFSRTEDLRLIEKSNKYFKHWYDLLEKNFPGCKTINFSKNYTSDFIHKRGCSPYHPTLDYYSDTIKQIQNIVESDYREKRKIKIKRLSFGGGKLSTDKLKEHGADDYQAHLFEKILRLTDVKNKVVLYIGNRTFSHSFIRGIQMEKFIQIYSDSNAASKSKRTVYNFSENYLPPKDILLRQNFAIYCGNLAEVNEDFLDLCDIAILDNMEEVSELSIVFDLLYKLLKNGGELIGKTARTWSCNSGSKYYISKNMNYLKPGEMKLMFPHLLLSYGEIHNLLSEFIKDELQLNEAATKMAGGNGLNHLFYEDYEKLFQNTLFSEKRIAPVFPDSIPESILSVLVTKYPVYREINYKYKSLYIYGKK